MRRFEAAARVAAPVDGQKRLRYRRKCPLIVVTTSIALALAVAGCGGDGDESDEEAEELTVSAASSLTEAFEAYGSETEIEEKFSFAGSDDLAAQIREGAPVDVFASANTSLPDALFEEGLVDEPTTFIANELVIAVPAESPFAGQNGSQVLNSLAGDIREQPDLVIGAEGVPAGDYTRELLAKLPDDDEQAILSSVRSEEPDVKSIVAKLTTGAADVGFVYASDVDAAGGSSSRSSCPPSSSRWSSTALRSSRTPTPPKLRRSSSTGC